MPDPKFSDGDRSLLSQVLELQPSTTRKNTPALSGLSLYSSELKSLKHIANLLASVDSHNGLNENEISRNRYFNTLSNQGLVTGTALQPELTASGLSLLKVRSSSPSDEYWRVNGPEIELAIVRPLATKLANGEHVSETFKHVWYNVQFFLDLVPKEELGSILADPEKALFLFHINSVGWEVGRYYRLPKEQRAEFEQVFAKVPTSGEWTPPTPIEKAASLYKDAAGQFQSDVRFRINGFLNAYVALRDELKDAFPRLDKQLQVRSRAGSVTNPSKLISGPAPKLPVPYQLIVAGCPGSGKSHYIDEAVRSNSMKAIRTQFHPETSFFDFVGAYKPYPVYETFESSGAELIEADGTPVEIGKPVIDYRFVPGPLVQAITFALLNPGENVVVVIEEINRGNAAAILGDFLQLLDRDGSGVSRYGIQPSLELKSYFARAGIESDEVKLPSNLFIWATMNNADQGVFPLDTAFRRRWNYIYKGYSEPCHYPSALANIKYGGVSHSWDVFRETLNDALIQAGIHEDKLIGPYFLTVEQLASPANVLEKLMLYLWDDVLRLRQEILFSVKSFSVVARMWADGEGAPLSLNFVQASPEVDDDQNNSQ